MSAPEPILRETIEQDDEGCWLVVSVQSDESDDYDVSVRVGPLREGAVIADVPPRLLEQVRQQVLDAWRGVHGDDRETWLADLMQDSDAVEVLLEPEDEL